MENKQLETGLEQQYLEKTLAVARTQLTQANQAAEDKKLGMAEIKKEARENAVHSVTDLYDADDFEALAELSQYTNAISQIISDYEEEKRKIARLENFMLNPYFARIDFQFEGEEEAEKIYIGRTALSQKSTGEIYVYDWRSPIASVFYRFMSGKAFYDAPCGKIEGEVKLKRQYEIKNGVLEYFFDTDMNISDEILRQILSKNTSPKMKAIVETIQKEQDIIIRDMDSSLLIVQGVAGSGKTSIALHRAAYLMYQGLQSKLPAASILIISPNHAFEQYISDVLPELGEENVNSAVFEDLLETILPEKQIQPKIEFLEQVMAGGPRREIIKSSMEFKMSAAFRRMLDRFLEDIPLRFIEFHDIYHDGQCIITRSQMQDWVAQRPDVLLGQRLGQLEDYVLELAFGVLKKRKDAEGRNRMKQEIQQFTQFDIGKMYQKLFIDKSYFDSLAGSLGNQKLVHDIWLYTRDNFGAGRICHDDATAMAYLSLKIYGLADYKNIRQVVIDEAQDYYPLQYEIFRLLFADAKLTVLGDINQTLAKAENMSLYSQIQEILGRGSAKPASKPSLVTLDKSFRCTNEILNFSLQFIEHRPQIQSFNRQGDMPKATAVKDGRALLDAVIEETSTCQEKGLGTVCLICKNKENSEKLYGALKPEMDVRLVAGSSIEDLQGTFIMPSYLTKGLEFDAAIVCDVDKYNYNSEDDRKLLYVACTRALHRLRLVCIGEMSPLIV